MLVAALNLPSFLWLWRIAAWSMGLSLSAYLLLAVTGGWLFVSHRQQNASLENSLRSRPGWLRPLHLITGAVIVFLVLLLLAVGLVGTLGYYGSLGHSPHLAAGLAVVGLTLLSGWSALQINPQRAWARSLHLGTNLALLFGLAVVSWTGWTVVQKYLP
jgi:nitrate reductase NapE component